MRHDLIIVGKVRRREFDISDALASRRNEGRLKPISVRVRPVVEPKHFFIKIVEQVKRLDADVSAFQAPFQQRPKVFQAARVNLPESVVHGMVNELVYAFGGEAAIALLGVRIQFGEGRHFLLDLGLQRLFGPVLNDLRPNLRLGFLNGSA